MKVSGFILLCLGLYLNVALADHDNQRVSTIHQALAAKQVLPERHLVDARYMDGELLFGSQQNYGITLCEPLSSKNTWQAKTKGAYAIDDFLINCETEQVTCLQGKQRIRWYQGLDKRNGNPLAFMKFAKDDWSACQQRQHCTRAETRPRSLAFKQEKKQQTLQQASLGKA